jgi:hypothetical protein
MKSARKQEALGTQLRRPNPVLQRVARLLGDLELHRTQGLLLHHHRPRGNLLAMSDIAYPQFDQIAAPQLAVDCQVEERKVTQVR